MAAAPASRPALWYAAPVADVSMMDGHVFGIKSETMYWSAADNGWITGHSCYG
jgi:acyl-coenzyme A synthetase/AMP-(fatty) acid ligase